MSFYSENTDKVFEQYQSLNPDQVHESWLKYLPKTAGMACDIGAGSGRDANWLANKGWDVIAVEPCKELRDKAQTQKHPNVTWLDDSLPDLEKLRKLGHRFNLILLSAVWMHILPAKRERAFRVLTELLEPNGLLVITLRHSKNDQENLIRNFYQVNSEEIQQFAKHRAIAVLSNNQQEDQLGRNQVSWETIVLQLPDDGTGSLPLLRHIIVNDDKSSTYKLGLLRTLIRIAEGAPGMVINRNDEWVEIPFGLVGLYWLKLYMPLVLTHKVMVSPTHKIVEQKGLGFAKSEHFYQLKQFSPYDLRVGAVFSVDSALVIIGSIKDACANIQQMPAHFITYPGQNKKVFECNKSSVKVPKGFWQINKESLSQFGSFRIPTKLWQSFSQYSCWIEPAIVNEWAKLMMGYEIRYDRSVYDKALEWDEGKRDTSQVRKRVEALQQKGESIHCVWSNTNLKENNFEVDHCFPWSRWYNNDLWNLLPASVIANGEKREKLPTALLMHESKERIVHWWETAYVESDFKEQFLMEAESSLALLETGTQNLNLVFEAMLHQRAKLKANQQLAEWKGC